MNKRVAVWTLAEKIAVAERLFGAGWNISAETRIAKSALAAELVRHEAEKSAIAERFDVEVWRAIEANWTAEELRRTR